MKRLKPYLRNSLCILLLLLSVFACVPQKKMIYLQPTDDNITNSTFYYDDLPYRLKPEDVISLNVFSLTPGQFNFFGGGEGTSGGGVNNFLVNKDGFVELPAVGNVKISGLTLEEAEDNIKDLLEDYLQTPLVRISLATPFTYHMVGEVSGPGVYQTVVGDEPNLLEAIARAGDLTTFADRENIRIVRRENGEINIFDVNVLEDEVLGNPLFQIRQDDIIIVDPLKARGFRESQTFFFSILGSLTGVASIILFIVRGRR
jgi:polysaccharide export outer membrane protein